MDINCIVDIASREVSFQENYRIAAYDHNVDVIHFSVEPIEDFSLNTSSIKIAAQGPNNVRHDYAVDPSTVSIEEETGYITFDWPIPQGVTEMPIGTFKYGDKGRLIFAVCAEIISGDTVSKAWHSDDGIITVVAHLEPESGGGEDPEEEATNAQKIGQLQTATAILQREISRIASGTPPTASTIAEMDAETSTVYIYTGSETGYTAGNWYFWNGSAWTSGGTYGGAVTDTTLSISGSAADAKAVGDALTEKADADDVGDLSQLTTTAKDNLVAAINETNEAITGINGRLVDKNGVGEVTPQNLQIVDAVISKNLWNPDTLQNGYTNKDGIFTESNSYRVSGLIPVEAGQAYVFTCKYQGDRGPAGMRYVTCYGADKNVMSASGSNREVSQPYTIPSNVHYIKITTYYNAAYTEYQFEKGTSGTAYYPYGTLVSAVIKEEYIPDVDIGKIPAFNLVDGQNLFNRSDPNFADNKYINRSGTLNDSNSYLTTGFIDVVPGDIIIGSYMSNSGNTAGVQLKYIAAYNSSKSAIVNSGVSAGSSHFYVVPEGIYYVRISINKPSYTEYLQIERNHTGNTMWKPYKPYEAPHYELLDSYTPQGKQPLHVYLPSEIYVAVGRTIEFYNELVCIDHEKYRFRWVCAEGAAYKRKFSITGRTVKNLNLDLYLYDDEQNVCWCGRCVIHVVAASNPTKKILPIGDSLTNWKAWLQETMLLSGNHITWVGTRYSGASWDSEGNEYPSGTIHHEGRSGWKASDYLSDATYDFDDRYDGVGTVAGTANPFWDGTKFSLSHYLTVQTGVDTPDAVQIFLGTNDIRLGIEPATANIVSMVQTIRTEYPDMPIFICNTIYNANQNGYGSVGSDAYSGGSGASAYQYEQDCLVMDLMKGLRTALTGITNVYIIPLATCMDREYNFGQVMTKVNPRSNVEVAMPVERIHPQAPGYYQMADLMYSFYCGLLI